jgi:hypothetical protein
MVESIRMVKSGVLGVLMQDHGFQGVLTMDINQNKVGMSWKETTASYSAPSGVQVDFSSQGVRSGNIF